MPLPPFEQLDFIYEPSADVAADLTYLAEVMGARVVFAIEAMGVRVAMLELSEQPPHLLLTDHLEGERPVFVYRIVDLAAALSELAARGLKPERSFEIPMGPCCSFVTAGGHRVALYQSTRPEVMEHFKGRRDF